MAIALIKMMVLRELNNMEQSGYDLMKKIGEISNDKPSPGYMYPLLRDLEKRGFVSFIEEKRRKVYSITKEGRKFLKNLTDTHQRAMKIMIKNFEQISTKDEMKNFYTFQTAMKQNKDIMIADMGLLDGLKRAVFSIYQKDYEMKKSKFRSIIKNATKQIEGLSKK